MTEQRLLEELAAETGLIGHRPDEHEQRERHAEFTRRAAFTLAPYGYGNVRKTIGNHVRGLSVDKIANPLRGTLVDIIVDADGVNPRLGWGEQQVDDAADLYVAPQPEPGEQQPPAPAPPPPPPFPGPGEPDETERFIELMSEFVESLVGVAEALRDHTREMKRVNDDGVRIHL